MSHSNYQVKTSDQSNHSINISGVNTSKLAGAVGMGGMALAKKIERQYIQRFGKETLAKIRKVYAHNMEKRNVKLQALAKAKGKTFTPKAVKFSFANQLFTGLPTAEELEAIQPKRARVRGTGRKSEPVFATILPAPDYKVCTSIGMFSEMAASQVAACQAALAGVQKRRSFTKAQNDFINFALKEIDKSLAATHKIVQDTMLAAKMRRKGIKITPEMGLPMASATKEIIDADALDALTKQAQEAMSQAVSSLLELRRTESDARGAQNKKLTADAAGKLTWDALRAAKKVAHCAQCQNTLVAPCLALPVTNTDV
jgi:hypothetical protein